MGWKNDMKKHFLLFFILLVILVVQVQRLYRIFKEIDVVSSFVSSKDDGESSHDFDGDGDVESIPPEEIISVFSFPSIPPSMYFILLAIQCGCAPITVKLFMPTSITRSTVVIAQEGVKLAVSILYLISSNKWSEATKGWTWQSSFLAAGLPALLYAIQGYINLMATQTLPPVTFIVLNQTKTLSTALCCFLLMGQKQSPQQIFALIMVVAAALIIQKVIPVNCEDFKDGGSSIETGESLVDSIHDDDEMERNLLNDADDIEKKSSNDEEPPVKKKLGISDDEMRRQFTYGVAPALVGSFLSGLAGTLAQMALQQSGRSPHLFNSELAVFSSSFIVASLAAGSPDCQKIKKEGIFANWTYKTFIPILNAAVGGILVGLVTKHQGAVVKGFAMIFGMAISGVLQQILYAKEGGGVTLEQIVGGALGAFSLWMHISY